MTSSVRILTTSTVDSTPSILLIAPSGDKILVNCGEGCQRAFLEASGLKLKSVTRICVTHVHPYAVGGLPGMLLTAADAVESAHIAVTAAQQAKEMRRQQNRVADEGKQSISGTLDETTRGGSIENPLQQQPPEKKRQPSPVDDMNGGIEIYGPIGTKAFIHSLRHFMRRDRFEFRVKEGEGWTEAPAILQQKLKATSATEQPKRKKKKQHQTAEPPVIDFSIRALACTDDNSPLQSYLFQTPPLVGRFRPDRAAELGIPKGPLYASLKNGQSVTFVNKEGVEVTVQSNEVLEPGHVGGVAVAVIYCPTRQVLQQLKEFTELKSFQSGVGRDGVFPSLDAMVHVTPLANDSEYEKWADSFKKTDHIWLDNAMNHNPTPYEASCLGGMMRSKIHPLIYAPPVSGFPENKSVVQPSRFIHGERHLEYILIPRGKRGIKEGPSLFDQWQEKLEEASKLVCESGAVEAAKTTIASIPVDSASNSRTSCGILFTGTGSALPCKHRNVTGICLTLSQSRRMLLDCGEGTIGQLFRSDPTMSLESIQAVWISHPHADHHLGVLRLLCERDCSIEPLLIIAPPNMFAFLTEYEAVVPSVRGTYLKLDCYDALPGSAHLSSEMKHLLSSRLGITSITSIIVSHCRHAFAVVIDCDTLGRVAYSGDCRPSMKFAEVACKADILIHEATFEDGMEEEAVLKKHSTVGEALSVAQRMEAKQIILTHFSQRYPRIPPLPRPNGDDNTHTPDIVFAFDFMKVTPASILLAAKLTDALRLLYPEDDNGGKKANETDAKQVLSVPGMFAKSELL